jgi:uncharacterized protein
MTFVDTNVIIYAVGGEHPLRARSRAFFEDALERRLPLAISAEVLQELLHVYLPVRRETTLDAALALVTSCVSVVWPLEEADVRLARELAGEHEGLGARDLLHLACCMRRRVERVMTFDRGLAAAFGG